MYIHTCIYKYKCVYLFVHMHAAGDRGFRVLVTRKIPDVALERLRSVPGIQLDVYEHSAQVCCRVMQGVAGCFNLLQCVAMCCSEQSTQVQSVRVAVWCRLLQCIAACNSMLQCVAVCCSVLRCVGVSRLPRWCACVCVTLTNAV